MKRKLLTLALMLGTAVAGLAQSPESINYQAVARDNAGALLNNQNLDVRIGIYSGSAGTVQEYEETHAVTTNQFGQFSLRVGEGTVISGTFSNIGWEADQHHLKVEVDDGTGYVDLGTTQLVSVPYALHAESATHATTADEAGPWELNGTTAFYNNGYVGIGTDSPTMPISLYTNSGSSYMRFSDNITGISSGLRVGLSGTGDAYIINDEPTKELSLGTDGTTKFRINASGYVGVNAMSPAQALHIKQLNSNRGLRIEHNSTSDYWENGVGVTTKNYKFYYNNLFRADISSVDGAYTQSSDRRLKTNIIYMESVLDRVMELKPATYNYVDNSNAAVRSTGFVAQEVQEVFPHLVRDMEDGYKGVVYDGFAVVSIKAIQELNEQVKELQQEVKQLKEELNK